MGERGPVPQSARQLAAKNSWRAKKRAKEEAGTADLRPKVWDRKTPTEREIVSTTKSIMLIPGFDPYAQAGEAKFDATAGKAAVRWFHKHLTHVKGSLTGQALKLSPMQQGIVANLFGWKEPDGSRRFREAFIYVPRKWGKTLFAAGLALYPFFEDGEGGSEAFCAAAARDQAGILRQVAMRQVLNDEGLMARCLPEINAMKRLDETGAEDGSLFRSICAQDTKAHGFNPHVFVLDEVHVQKSGALWEVLETGTGSRANPLKIAITTADYARESICNEMLDTARKVRDGVIEDSELLPVILEATEDDDWQSEEVWQRVNPNMPITPTLRYMRKEAAKAARLPRFLNTFKRLHLNIVTNADVAWFDLNVYDLCNAEPVCEGPAFGGLDLAKTTDLTCFKLYWPETHSERAWYWIPRDTVVGAERRDSVPYLAWERNGFLELTEGNVCDYDFVRGRILDICAEYQVAEVGYDNWNATQMALQLQEAGLVMVEVRQGYQSLSEPSKELERLIISKQLRHGGHPVSRYCASNVMVEMDHTGNIRPTKTKSTGRIDGVVASVMAIGRSIKGEGPFVSVYEESGNLML